MKFLILLLISISTNIFAGIEQAPPNFMVKGSKAVFIDFQTAQYNLEYDTKNQKVSVHSLITFHQNEKGHPLFDSINKIESISINNVESRVHQVSSPGNVTKLQMVNVELMPGTHTMELRTSMSKGVSFNTERNRWHNVSSAFFIRDLKDRMFLEKYLPTNLEFDQYQMNMNVAVTGTNRFHSLFVNGKMTKHSENNFSVEFPNYYSSSSVFFHLVPINKFVRWYLKYPSIDGRELPVTIYSSFRFYNNFLKKKAWNVLSELEKDYGPWPHDQLIIYGTGIKGGMEYAGATETSIVSLGHELQHSYFAKGIHPANGNSGWLDEAIASWRDKGHQSHDLPFYQSANLAAHSPYTRKTDKRSYEYGRSFMAYIDYQLKNAGRLGLKDFLAKYFHKRKFTTVTTEDFRSDLEDYAQMSFSEDFRQYLYGVDSTHKDSLPAHNPHHPEISEDELNSIL